MSTNMKAILALGVVVILGVAAYFVYQNYSFNTTEEEIPIQVKSKPVPGPIDKVVIAYSPILGIYPNMTNESRTFNVNANIFEGLVGFDQDLKVVKKLAENWVNPDNLTWKFTLNKKATFHNKEALKASDVKFSIDEAIKNDWAGAKQMLSPIESVTATDDSTVEIKTKIPFPALLNRLTQVFILNQQAFTAKADSNIGTGPYKLKEWKENQSLALEANTNYYGTKPLAAQVVYKIMADANGEPIPENDQLTDLLASNLNLITFGYDPEVYDSLLAVLKKNKDKVTTKETYDAKTVMYIHLDAQRDKTPGIQMDKNPLKDKRVRQAIYLGLDLEKIISKVPGGAIESTQLITDKIFGYNPQIKKEKYNPAKAKDLLTQAEYPEGFVITLDYIQGMDEIAQEIQTGLKTIGIEIKLNALERTQESLGKIMKGETSMYLMTGICETNDASEILEWMYHSPNADGSLGPQNIFGFKDAELDQLIDEAGQTIETKKRQSLLQQAMQITMQDLTVLPLFSPKRHYAFTDTILWTPRTDGNIMAADISGRKSK